MSEVNMKKALNLSIRIIRSIDSEFDQLESAESMTWYESLKPEQQNQIKGEAFELLTGQTYKSMRKIFSHEQLVKIAYDKLKMEGFDV